VFRQESGGAAESARDIVECGAGCQSNVAPDGVPVLEQPSLLQWHPETDQQEVRCGAVDEIDDLSVRVRTRPLVEEAVVLTCDLQSRKTLTQAFRRVRGDSGPTAQKEDPKAVALAQLCELPCPIGIGDTSGEAVPEDSGAEHDPGAIAEDDFGSTPELVEPRLLPGQVQGVHIDVGDEGMGASSDQVGNPGLETSGRESVEFDVENFDSRRHGRLA
jgi:hypothetical protein